MKDHEQATEQRSKRVGSIRMENRVANMAKHCRNDWRDQNAPPPDNSKTILGHPSHFGKRRWYRDLREVIEAVNSMIVDLGMDQLTFWATRGVCGLFSDPPTFKCLSRSAFRRVLRRTLRAPPTITVIHQRLCLPKNLDFFSWRPITRQRLEAGISIYRRQSIALLPDNRGDKPKIPHVS